MIHEAQAGRGAGPEVLGGRFQVRRPFAARARSGCRFATFELYDGAQTLRAYAWESNCKGFFLPRHRERVYAAGRLRRRNGRLELVCAELRVEDPTPQIRWARDRLRELVRDLDPPVLTDFLRRGFADPAIGPAFLVAPASLAHHHAFSGGLLVHSTECAAALARWMEGEPHRGVATVAALLHDVGKVRTLCGDMTRTALGTLVRHEALTLEVLAPHLAWLDGQWPAGARLLRHLLTAQPRREEPSPARLALELLRTADRLSAERAPGGSRADSGFEPAGAVP
jgi:3'-5' exoribonuclease